MTAERIFAWVVIVVACAPFVAILGAFHATLQYKRSEVTRRLVPDDAATLTRTQPGLRTSGAIVPTDARQPYEVVSERFRPDRTFERFFAARHYVVPLAFVVVTTLALAMLCLARIGLDVGGPAAFVRLASAAPSTVVAGAGGAYLWSLFDFVRRYRATDITPSSLHFVWVRMAVAAALAPMLTPLFNPTGADLAAFGLGAFPLQAIQGFVQRRLPGVAGTEPEDPPNLHLLQGVTADVKDRLEEEGIERVQHLAFADPIRLLLRSNVDWNVLLDLMDQAILVNYVGEKIQSLRQLGVRGAIEVATIYTRVHESTDPADRANGQALAALVATALDVDSVAVFNLAYQIRYDPLVQFIWVQWSGVVPEELAAEGPAQAELPGLSAEVRA